MAAGAPFLAGIMLTAPFKFRDAGRFGDADFVGDSFSLGLAVAVTVIPRVANMFATALASDFFGSTTAGLGGGFRTLRVIESERCMMLFSDGSGVPP